MATVPYTGVPSVAPQDTPIGRDQVQATPEMFGATIGQAISHLGATSDAVGNEIFARGQAMQDLYNHSQAQDADAQYSMQAGQIYEKMKALSGKDAVDYYVNGGYQKDLTDARTNIRAGLPNGMAQKMFDSTTLSTFTRTNLYGASYSGEQNRHFALSSAKAGITAANDQVAANPDDEEGFQSALDNAESHVRFASQQSGLSPEAADEAVAQNRSKMYTERIKGVVRSQPFKAGDMLDDAIQDGDVRGEDITNLRNLVQGQQTQVGSRLIAHQTITGADNRYGAGPVDIHQAQMAIGQIESGGNYSTMGVQTSHGQALGKYQVMSDFLPEFLASAGMPAMSAKDFLANHAAQDQLFASRFGGYMQQTGSFNDAASMWLTGKPLAAAGNVKDALGTNAQTYVARANAELAKNAPLTQKLAIGQQLAQEQAPNNPLLPEAVTQQVEAASNRIRAAQRDDIWQTEKPIEAALMGGKDGKIPTSPGELTADSEVAAAWEKLQQTNPAKVRYYNGILKNNSKNDYAQTDDALREYLRLKGEINTDPTAFIDEDIVGKHMPMTWRKELGDKQLQVYKNPSADNPAVTRALGWLGPDLAAAGFNKKTDPDRYNEFVGSLQDQLVQFAKDNTKPPAIKDVQQMGARLMQSFGKGGWFSSAPPMFDAPVPDIERAKIVASPSWQRQGIVPTDENIRRVYNQQLYKTLYGGSRSQPQQQVQAAGPQSPVSE